MPSKSKKQAKLMTAACKSPEFRKKVDISKDVACKFHKADKGKYHEDTEMDRMKELAGITEYDMISDDPVFHALEEAYVFITQPMRMETRSRGQTILTYHTNKYNEITAKLREAMNSLRMNK